ncbi:CsbD family protein [Kibdelosporangium philippinense]|uniref:CsbD family protein n=2 Tax=Kibdelosporangium philippinense TaxID=211113 RepID=A0ABS8ZQH9_9PSEU|nr:CsbD family protein [Kibdelosporangium philippinense]MCE7009448.1 CsbD family protein [Kibdelosporangium philippinense]
MSAFDKAKDKAEQLIGKGKEKLGQATDNEEMEAAGKRDQLKGEVKEAGHDIRDKAAGAAKDAKDSLRDDK